MPCPLSRSLNDWGPPTRRAGDQRRPAPGRWGSGTPCSRRVAGEEWMDSVDVRPELKAIDPHRRAGRMYEKAERRYRAALEVNADDGDALVGLGWLLVERENVTLGLDYLERAVALGVDTPELHLALGEAWISLNRYEEAVCALRRCIRLRFEWTHVWI